MIPGRAHKFAHLAPEQCAAEVYPRNVIAQCSKPGKYEEPDEKGIARKWCRNHRPSKIRAEGARKRRVRDIERDYYRGWADVQAIITQAEARCLSLVRRMADATSTAELPGFWAEAQREVRTIDQATIRLEEIKKSKPPELKDR